MKRLLLLFSAFLFAVSTSCSSDDTNDTPSKPVVEGRFSLHSFLQDGMVIQQNQPFTLWGRSKPGVEISAAPSWTDQTYACTVADDGSWRLDVPVPGAPADNAPQFIRISTTLQTETLRDLLIGEVWLLGGQSNMTFWMSQVRDAAAEIAAADFPLIRYYTVAPGNAAKPLYDWREPHPTPFYHWTACTPETAAQQSAVGYYFGRMLHQELGVPVGLVNTSYGGAAAQAYTPREALMSEPVLKEAYINPFVDNPDLNVLIRPSELYNDMVHPLLPLSIRGFAWYQGEGNWDRSDIYPLLIRTMIRSWRRGFDRGSLPFYYVQIAPYGLGGDTTDPAWFYTQGPAIGYAYMREAQAKTRDEVENTGMAVTMDVGNPVDIHPVDKRPVGERLARLALRNTYGRTEIVAEGPRYRSHRVEQGVVKVSFDHAEGLRTRDGAAPLHFYAASASGDQHVFHPVEAEIHGEEVWFARPAAITSDEVAIRYAFLLYPETNLENGAGLPAEPFRTDAWTSGISYVF